MSDETAPGLDIVQLLFYNRVRLLETCSAGFADRSASHSDVLAKGATVDSRIGRSGDPQVVGPSSMACGRGSRVASPERSLPRCFGSNPVCRRVGEIRVFQARRAGPLCGPLGRA